MERGVEAHRLTANSSVFKQPPAELPWLRRYFAFIMLYCHYFLTYLVSYKTLRSTKIELRPR